MSCFVFAAHDPGGAKFLGAVITSLLNLGHRVNLLASGPAINIWRKEGYEVTVYDDRKPEHLTELVKTCDGLVTGTGFGSFERELWPIFAEQGIKTIAVIDSWTNFKLRFISSNSPVELVFPDAIMVIDDWSVEAIHSEGWCSVPVFKVGHPHLQLYVPQIIKSRQQKIRNKKFRLVFFSEPINQDFPDRSRGFDQFEVVQDIAEIARHLNSVELLIKPHPREITVEWERWISEREKLSISGDSTDDLLATADGVIGMTTMVLLEASLAGIPTLSYQPARTSIINPAVDLVVSVITKKSALEEALKKEVIISKNQGTVLNTSLQNVISNSERTFCNVIEQFFD